MFAWRKNKGSLHSTAFDESRDDDVVRPVKIYDISGVPVKSEDLPEASCDDSEKIAFPVPNEEGQEMAIQDEEHCYEDPANVHSMLTMPSFNLTRSNDDADDTNDKDAFVLLLTSSEDGTLVTDDGALFAMA
ncbi:MAG: hypothetical protein SGILL_003924, partial [Bacillariaceae sp.]